MNNWFIAKIVFGIHTNGHPVTQFDEQIRLIEAREAPEAFLKSRMLGAREEYSFMNEYAEEVKWAFIDVTELYPVSELKDGVELYSRIQETDSLEHYIEFIRDKAIELEKKMSEMKNPVPVIFAEV